MQSQLAILQYEREHQRDITILNGMWKMDIFSNQTEDRSYDIVIDKSGDIVILSGREDNWSKIKNIYVDFKKGHISIIADMKDAKTLMLSPFEPNHYKLTLLELSISTIESNGLILINYMEGEDNFGTKYRFRSKNY
ncbi:hypothetical protein D3C86_1623020 [compost metagenome]